MNAQVQITPATGTETVTVACKVLSGMRCRIHKLTKVTEVGMGSTRTVQQWLETDKEFVLAGPAHAQNEGPRHQIVAGFAITHGIRKDYWDEWREQNSELPAVKHGLIIAYASADKVMDAAKERKGIKTGLERLNPHDLPKIDARFKVQLADDNISQIGNVEA